MTLEEFRASRKPCDNIPAFIGSDEWREDGTPTHGFTYADSGLHIEQVDHPKGKYMLVLSNRDWLTDDLASLEVMLYEYGISDGTITVED